MPRRAASLIVSFIVLLLSEHARAQDHGPSTRSDVDAKAQHPAPEMHVRNRGLLALGIVMTTVGGGAAIAGTGLLSAGMGDGQSGGCHDQASGGFVERHGSAYCLAGGISLVLGFAAIGAGIGLTVYGGKHVPDVVSTGTPAVPLADDDDVEYHPATRTRLRDPGLLALGISMTTVGGVATFAGLVLLTEGAGAGDAVGVGGCRDQLTGGVVQRHAATYCLAGGVSLLLGLPAVGAGIGLTVFGGKHVLTNTHAFSAAATWMPQVSIGRHREAILTWAF